MTVKGWHRKSLTKVAAVLVAVLTLASVGMLNPASAVALNICDEAPEYCGEIITDGIDHGTTDGSGWLHDTELVDQTRADMPRTTSGTPLHPVVAVDRKQVVFDDVKPWINPETGRTLVPIRFVAEALGAKVTWTPDKPRDVLIEREGLRIHFLIGEDTATVNGRVVEMDQPTILKDNRTLVPLRFIAEAFGAKVDWVGADGPEDPRVPRDWPAKYQIWIWVDWGYWGNYSLGHRFEASNWNLRAK